jgi:MFS family permease
MDRRVSPGFTVLRQRSFCQLFLARTISLLGSAMAPIALAFAVLDAKGGSATTLGLVLAGRSIAQVLLLLFGGVLADRMSRFRLMVTSDLVAFTGQGGIAVLILTQTWSPVSLICLNLLVGASSALFLPASRGAVPQIVPDRDLQAANSLLRLSMNGTNVMGIALGGLLVATVGGGWALAIDAATYLISATLLSWVQVAHVTRAKTSTILADLRVGWTDFTARRWVWLVVVQFAFVNLCFTAVNVLGPLTAKKQLGGAAAWASISTSMAVGLVVGSLTAMHLRPKRPIRIGVLATFGFLPPFLLLGLGAPVWLIAASMFFNGFCVNVFEVLWDTTLQQHVPAGSISRISSYDAMASFVLGPIGLVLVGPVSSAIGTGRTLLGAGAILTVITAVSFASRSVRSVPAEAPEQESESLPA